MKHKLLIAIFVLVTNISFSQTNATNFNCNDCTGNNHDLFSELNAGKVIVLCWVMPCSACISPSRTAYDVVQTFVPSNPDRVYFYLVDDFADTPCNTLTSWGNNNGMPNAVKFSNAIIKMSDYGTAGMPKIVIVGGVNHNVYYNENNGANTAGIQPAINQALIEAGINEKNTLVSDLKVIPNPVQSNATLSYSLIETSIVKIDLIDVFGKTIKVISSENQAPGKYETTINYENISNGVYFLRLITGYSFSVIKVYVSH